jgi:hypothetical protein
VVELLQAREPASRLFPAAKLSISNGLFVARTNNGCLWRAKTA